MHSWRLVAVEVGSCVIRWGGADGTKSPQDSNPTGFQPASHTCAIPPPAGCGFVHVRETSELCNCTKVFSQCSSESIVSTGREYNIYVRIWNFIRTLVLLVFGRMLIWVVR